MCKNASNLMINMRLVLLVSVLCLTQTIVVASEIQASNANGKLQFSGEHAGMTFTGQFKVWEALIILPPSEEAKITASFDVGSAETGDATYDETLPEEDWFFVEKYPNSTFVSHSVELLASGFKVSGTLKLRGKSQKVDFVLEENEKYLKANFVIDRLAFDIGKDSDPDAEWVSKDINMLMIINKP